MKKWLGIFVIYFLLVGCGSGADESSEDSTPLLAISGNWDIDIDIDEGGGPTAPLMKYLSIEDTGDVFLYGLNPIENCYVQDIGTATNNGDGTFNTSFPQGDLSLSISGSILKINTGPAVINAEISSQDFSQFNLCSDNPEPPAIVLEDIQNTWKVEDIVFEDSHVFLHYFNISSSNLLTAYHYNVDEICYEIEEARNVSMVTNGQFSLAIGNNTISMTYTNGRLNLNGGSDDSVSAAVTSDNLNALAICGQVNPDPDPDPDTELTLGDIEGVWVYQSGDQSHYVSINSAGLFKRFALDDTEQCYNNVSGSITSDGSNTFTVRPASDDSFAIELTKDGEAFQSSSPLGEVEFIRSTKTEGELTPECSDPIVFDTEMTIVKLQGSFGTLTSSGSVIGGNHLPFRFVAGSLLSFVSYDFSGGCHQRQGYWLEELGEGRFKKTEVLTGDTEMVGFIREGISVSMVNVNTGSILELGDYNSAGDYSESGSNHITRGVNLLGCKENSPESAQLVGGWYSDSILSFIRFDIDSKQQLIRTKYLYDLNCYNFEENKVISDASSLNVFDGVLAMKDGESNFYNRVLEKDLPLLCVDTGPDLTLTLEDIVGLWSYPSETGGEFYYDITVEGAMTLYENSFGDICLNTYRPSKLTRIFNGKFTEYMIGATKADIISFRMPSADLLMTYYGNFDRPGLKMERAGTTLEDLNSRVCDK